MFPTWYVYDCPGKSIAQTKHQEAFLCSRPPISRDEAIQLATHTLDLTYWINFTPPLVSVTLYHACTDPEWVDIVRQEEMQAVTLPEILEWADDVLWSPMERLARDLQ
jgi:hypothetical protein